MIEVTLKDGRVGQLIDIQIMNDLNEPPKYLLCFEDEGLEWFSLSELADRY